MYGLLYFSGQFFLEFTRGDEAIYLGPWLLAQWLNLAFALAAAVGLLLLWWQASKHALAQETAETDIPAEVRDSVAATVPVEEDPTEQETPETQVRAEMAEEQDGAKETDGTADPQP